VREMSDMDRQLVLDLTMEPAGDDDEEGGAK
jgi:hypothetical protein